MPPKLSWAQLNEIKGKLSNCFGDYLENQNSNKAIGEINSIKHNLQLLLNKYGQDNLLRFLLAKACMHLGDIYYDQARVIFNSHLDNRRETEKKHIDQKKLAECIEIVMDAYRELTESISKSVKVGIGSYMKIVNLYAGLLVDSGDLQGACDILKKAISHKPSDESFLEEQILPAYHHSLAHIYKGLAFVEHQLLNENPGEPDQHKEKIYREIHANILQAYTELKASGRDLKEIEHDKTEIVNRITIYADLYAKSLGEKRIEETIPIRKNVFKICQQEKFPLGYFGYIDLANAMYYSWSRANPKSRKKTSVTNQDLKTIMEIALYFELAFAQKDAPGKGTFDGDRHTFLSVCKTLATNHSDEKVVKHYFNLYRSLAEENNEPRKVADAQFYSGKFFHDRGQDLKQSVTQYELCLTTLRNWFASNKKDFDKCLAEESQERLQKVSADISRRYKAQQYEQLLHGTLVSLGKNKKRTFEEAASDLSTIKVDISSEKRFRR